MTGRVIAAWPSFALIGSYELLMRQIRAAATAPLPQPPQMQAPRSPAVIPASVGRVPAAGALGRSNQRSAGLSIRQEALEWAMANGGAGGRLPSGKAIADQFGRHERWGRLVKRSGLTGDFNS